MNILFVSLGCDKNLVDTEVMLGLLTKNGHQMVDSEDMADVIVVNTCCFIHDAKEESIQTILEMAEYKKSGSLKALIVTGCLAQRYKQEILDEIEEVDAVLGTTSYDKIVDAIEDALKGKKILEMNNLDALPVVDSKRVMTTGGHFAYLKIAEGCDKHCTYCIIPFTCELYLVYHKSQKNQLFCKSCSKNGNKNRYQVSQKHNFVPSFQIL